jgi:hypothetical protein
MTKCNYCHEKEHWEECNKKNQNESKLKSEANVTTTDDSKNEGAYFFTSITFVIVIVFQDRNATKNI